MTRPQTARHERTEGGDAHPLDRALDVAAAAILRLWRRPAKHGERPRPVPRLCAVGVHWWRVVSVTGVRVVRTASGFGRVCSITRSCTRCAASRHEQHVTAPRDRARIEVGT